MECAISTVERGVADEWRMRDAMWERLEGFLPKYRGSSKGARPRVELRSVADGTSPAPTSPCTRQWFSDRL